MREKTSYACGIMDFGGARRQIVLKCIALTAFAYICGCSSGSSSSNDPTQVATPTFNPVAGTYSSPQSVTISDSTNGATMYYTTNGTTPTTLSAKYSGAISVSSTTTIEVIAAATGMTNSSVATATYTIQAGQAATPTFSPAAATYSSAQSVTISDSTSGATVYYTTDGTTPTTSSTKYTSAIAVSTTTTIEAIAVATGMTNSSVATATYTIQAGGQVATPTFSPAAGTYTSAQSVTISDSTSGASIYYTTNSTTPTTSSSKYTSAISVNSTTTIEAIAVATGLTNSAVASATYTIQTSSSSFAGVLTQHNDNARTGQNLNETTLTTTNVNSSSFGKLFSAPVDGYIYAQPLYVPNLSIAGSSHNVVYVATENDSVYAFDADSGTQLWHVSVVDSAHGGQSGEKAVPIADLQAALGDTGCTDLVPLIGITSTPVIDPTTNTMYVEAKSEIPGTGFFHRLHMLDITTGAEKSPSGPALISATVPGTADGGTTVVFDPIHHLNRPGLLLVNGSVYLSYASHCDDGPWHGWLFAYNATTLAQQGVYISTAHESAGAGGFWQSGAGLAADSSGNIFAATGNGAFNTVSDFGDTVLKVALSGSSISVVDWFTPFNQGFLEMSDVDPGSGGVLILPDQAGTYPHELVQAGKDGTIHVLNRDQLTIGNVHYCSTCTGSDQQNGQLIVQEIQNAFATDVGDFGMPAYWNGTVYFGGSYQGISDVLRAFGLSNGQLAAASTSSTSFGFPGSTPSISANGTSNGILWAIDSSQFGTPGPAVLHAYDATNLGHELWNSTQSCPGGCNNKAGNAVKFTVPTIANGKVYMGTQAELDVYGLP